MHTLGAAGDQQVFVPADAGHGHVGLVAAAVVEQRRVDRAAGRHRDVVGAQVLQRSLRVAALDGDLGERGLVEDRDLGASGEMLGGAVAEPVLPAPAVFDNWLDSGRREPVRPLPAHLRAETRAASVQ